MTITIDTVEPRELAARVGDGVEVRLLWRPGSADVVVEVVDSRLGERIMLDVAGDQALDAFHHPFAYAARCGALPTDPSELMSPLSG